jgi:hypothetical protein
MYGQDEWLSPARVQKPAYSFAPAGLIFCGKNKAPVPEKETGAVQPDEPN